MKLFASFTHDDVLYTAAFDIGRIARSERPGWARFKSARGAELLGAHLFVRALVTGSVLELALVVNNGTLEVDGSFKGAIIAEDFLIGTGLDANGLLPIIEPLAPRFGEGRARGTDPAAWLLAPRAILPACSSFTRRFLLGPAGTSAENLSAFAARWRAGEFHSGPPARRAHPKAASEVPARIAEVLVELASESPRLAYDGALHDGSPNWIAPRGVLLGLGNVSNAGEQGGALIDLCPDWSGTAAGGVLAALLADLAQERLPLAHFSHDGKILTREELGYNWMHDLYRAAPFVPPPFRFGPSFSGAVESAMIPYDLAHAIRFGPDIAADELIADEPSRLRTRMWAEDMRLGLSEKPLSSGSDYVFPSLAAAHAAASARPHAGGDIPRAMGDAMWLGAACLRVLTEGIARTGEHSGEEEVAIVAWRAWRDLAVEVAELVQTPAGFPQMVAKDSGLDQNEEWSPPIDPKTGKPAWRPFAADELGCTTWQPPRWISGLFALAQGPIDPILRERIAGVVGRAVRGLYLSPRPLVADEDGHGFPGNPRYLVVGRAGEPLVEVVSGAGPSRPWYDRHALAIAYRMTGSRSFLDAMRRFGSPPRDSTHAALVDLLAASDPAQNAFAWRTARLAGGPQ